MTRTTVLVDRGSVLNEIDPEHTVLHLFRRITPGREALPADHHLPRHRHLEPYALVVIAGAFEQTSYAGRVIVRTGDLLVQPTLDCHANRLLTPGADVLRLAWSHVEGFGGVFRLSNIDTIVRLAERDLREASLMAQAGVARHHPMDAPLADWPDMLASDIACRRVGRLSEWAALNDLAVETVSRGFARVYGVAPVQFRNEMRTRDAWLQIVGTNDSLASIADATGFADQPHMTRSILRLTGSPPSLWRGLRPRAARHERTY